MSVGAIKIPKARLRQGGKKGGGNEVIGEK